MIKKTAHAFRQLSFEKKIVVVVLILLGFVFLYRPAVRSYCAEYASRKPFPTLPSLPGTVRELPSGFTEHYFFCVHKRGLSS